MILLDGKKTSFEIKEEIKKTVSAMKLKGERVPHLAAVIVGNDGASLTYVGNKVRSCEYVGFKSTLIKFENNISEIDLLKQIQKLNSDDSLDGYIVQLPLPKHIDEEKILLAIDSKKDVDGFHPENFGRMSLELDAFVPATPYGIIKLLERYKIPTEGKHCLVVGRSNIVGRPISILMSQKVFLECNCNFSTQPYQEFKKLTKQADIIIMALGIPEFLTSDMVKDDVV